MRKIFQLVKEHFKRAEKESSFPFFFFTAFQIRDGGGKFLGYESGWEFENLFIRGKMKLHNKISVAVSGLRVDCEFESLLNKLEKTRRQL